MRSWFRPAEDFRWFVVFTVATIASMLITAINDKADDNAVAPLFHDLRPAFDRGMSLVLPLAVALVWVGRALWRNIHTWPSHRDGPRS